MNNDLISREALKKEIEKYRPKSTVKSLFLDGLNCMFMNCISVIDNAPTVELDEGVIQEVLNKRCMPAVTNEYLIALHGKGGTPQGEWIDESRDSLLCTCCNKRVYKPFIGGFPTERSQHYYPNFCAFCGADMRKGGDDK